MRKTRLLQQYVTAQAQTRPEAIAVVDGANTVSYGSLEAQSNQLARLLRVAGCRRGDRIALLLTKSAKTVTAMIGALKADCAHSPVDPANPPQRLAHMIGTLEPRCILAAESAHGAIEQMLRQGAISKNAQIGWISERDAKDFCCPTAFTWSDLDGFPAEPVRCRNQAGDLAHILFTSGSTGVPSGVMITHANVVHFVEWAVKYFGMSPSDRTSGHSPLWFDLSTFDLFGSFAAGAALHLVPAVANILPQNLAEFIRNSRLTQWFSVPSVLNRMAKFDLVRQGDFPDLKRLLWCGEAFPTPGVIYWMQRLPHVEFTNLYGPTEATIASSYYTVPEAPRSGTEEVPIGGACGGEELLVLDENLGTVADNEVGELYIGGVGLSPGYWRDPQKTAAAFIKHPSSANPEDRIYKTGDLARRTQDGLIYLLGRSDSQIKSHGYRIEPGEIERALAKMPAIREAAVVAIGTDSFEGTTICCGYAVAEGTPFSEADLKKQLGESLPHYMIPSVWRRFDQLPLNQNGKIDRRKLQDEFREEQSKDGLKANAHGKASR